MNKLTSKQEKLLLLIGRNINKGMSEIGREIYSTNKSCYDVIYDFQERGFVEFVSYKNKHVPKITSKGQKEVDRIILAREM